MTGGAAAVPRERIPAGRVYLYAAAGGFLRRVNPAQADRLLASGLAEWRGQDLRLIELERFTPCLDGLHVTRRETPENARGCWAFRKGAVANP